MSINANALTAKTTPGDSDNLLLFDESTNNGTKIDYDALADAVLNKLTTKTFANQVGGSSAATILAQLATLNSNLSPLIISDPGSDYTWITAFKKAITDGLFADKKPYYGTFTRGGTYAFFGYAYSNHNYGGFLLVTPSNFYHYWIEAGVHKYRTLTGGTWAEV